jgi:glycerophosphoryl diester phosphodiesterase
MSALATFPFGRRSSMVSFALLCLLLVAAGPTDRRVVVIAHRGEHLHHPENTLPAIEAAIALGADYVEVDVRTTADGALVLSHDPNVSRCTDGHGEVAKMTLEQVRALDAGIKSGAEFAGTRIPTLDEALALARGRAGLYLDVKEARAQDLVRRLEDRHVVIYSRIANEIQQLNPALAIIPECVNAESTKVLIARLHPRLLACAARDFTPEIAVSAKAANARVYVDRMGATDQPEGWRAALDAGADGIQTDYHGELVRFLRAAPSTSLNN